MMKQWRRFRRALTCFRAAWREPQKPTWIAPLECGKVTITIDENAGGGGGSGASGGTHTNGGGGGGRGEVIYGETELCKSCGAPIE